MRKIKLLFAAALSMIAWTGVMAQSGTGAQNDPFVVKTAAELNNLRNLLVSGSMNYVVLEKDVDMAAIEDWFPLFNNVNPYPQIDFDGKGHVISNLTSKTDGAYDYCGLFGVLCGNVRNLGVENADVTCTGGTGIIAGYLGHSQYGQTCYVENVWVTGKLSASGYCGGMFGNIADESHITNCYANVEVTGASDLTGGIIGRVRNKVVMENVYAAGSINKGGGIIGGGFQDATPEGSYTNIAVWNNTENNFGPARESDDVLSGVIFYDGTNFADLQSQIVAWDPTVWSCDMKENSYPVLSMSTPLYEAALASINDGGCYLISTDVNGTKYYVTTAGSLTSTKDDGGIFTITKTVGGALKDVGFRIYGTAVFTNPPLSDGFANLNPGSFSTTTGNDRNDWERQVLFLKDGKYAIRSCNTAYGESSWADAGRTFWTYSVGEAVTPLYSYDPAYVWELEEDTFKEQQTAAKAKTESWAELIMSTSQRLVSGTNPWVSDAADSAEGCLDCLLDDNLSTFFHSDWHGAYTAGTHYIEATLPEAKNSVFFYYVTRSSGSGCPTNITVSASADGETWEDNLATINESDMPIGASKSYLTKALSFDKEYSHFRFYVHSTNSTTEGWFCLAEANLFVTSPLAAEAMALAHTNTFELTEEQMARIETLDTELRSTTINVTYELYDSDGTLVQTVQVTQEKNSDVSIPSAWTSNSKFFDYTTEGTIGNTDCTIIVKRTLKAGVVGALAQLSNDKAYTITCDRGAMLTNGETIASTANGDYASAEPGQFAIINYEGKYFLYSVADAKFVLNNGYLSEKLVNGEFDALVMDPKTTPYFMFSFKINETTSYGVNTNGSGNLGGIVINSWMNADPGNQYYMIEAADFDATAALAAIDAYFNPSFTVTYVVKDELGNVIFTSDPVPAEEGEKVTTLPAKYQRAYYTYDEVDVTVTEADTKAEFTATWGGPFNISADFESAKWYNMTMRGTWYVTTDVKDGDGAYKTQNANIMGLGEDSYQWAFIGNGYDGFKIINKAEGDGKSFGWTDATKTNAGIPTVMADEEGYHAWKVVASTNTSVPAGSFCLNVPGTDLYINQYGGAGGSVKFWNSANNIGDPGSAFTVYDVPSDFSEYVVSEVAPLVEATGYFTFTDAAKAAIGYDPAYKENCPFDTFKSMMAKIKESMGDVNNFVLPGTGYYTLTNKQYGTFMGIDPSDANVYGNYKASNNAKNVVKLTKVGADTYTIGLMGKFAPATVAQSAQVTATAEAGTFTVSVPAVGFAAFKADPEAQYSALHCASGGSVVGWEAAADASQWAVADAASINLTVGEAGYATAYLPFPVEIGQTLSVPAAVGTWTFDDGTTGSLVATDGVTVADGVATVPVGDNLAMANETPELGTYTIMMDVKIVNEDKGRYTSLYKASDTSEDGAIFFYNHKTNGRRIGINAGSMGYNGSYDLDTWYRVVVSCENAIPTVYVDGEKIVAATTASATHWTLGSVVRFFADNDGAEENLVQTDEIRFWDVALDEAEIAMLGAYGNVVPEPTSVVAYTGRVCPESKLWLQPLESSVIPAYTAVVLKGDPAVYEFAVVADEEIEDGDMRILDGTVDGDKALVKEFAAGGIKNSLKGTLEPIEAVGKYILAKPEGKEVGFYLAESGTIAAGKAYLEAPDNTENTGPLVKSFYFDFSNDPTGISNVEKVQTENGAIFNIAGQRLGKMQKGINIVNGKKVLF